MFIQVLTLIFIVTAHVLGILLLPVHLRAGSERIDLRLSEVGDLLLELTKMQLQVFIDLLHLQVLLFEVGSAVLGAFEFLFELGFGSAQILGLFFARNVLTTDVFKLLFELVQTGQLVLLNQIEIVFELYFFLENVAKFFPHAVQVTFRLAFVLECKIYVGLHLDQVKL